jgi:hypothetical protein
VSADKLVAAMKDTEKLTEWNTTLTKHEILKVPTEFSLLYFFPPKLFTQIILRMTRWCLASTIFLAPLPTIAVPKYVTIAVNMTTFRCPLFRT